MSDSTRLVSMVALVIVGLLIIAWGAIYIWLYRNDQLVVADLVRQGSVTAVQAARFTNPTWIWILAVIQIILGIALIIWGIFQYYSSVEQVTSYVERKVVDPAFDRMASRRGYGSRTPVVERDIVTERVVRV